MANKAMTQDCKAGSRPDEVGRRHAPILTIPGAEAGEAEALLHSTLDALTAHIAVLDETGTIIAVNQAWRSFADRMGFAGKQHGVGMNYLTICESGADSSEDAARTAEALRDILDGRRTTFRMEYPCLSPDGPRWFQLRINRPEPSNVPRIVVAHEDITEVKRAQEHLSQLSARLIQIQDEERRTIARELHDTTAQNLLAINLNMLRLGDALGAPAKACHRILAETRDLADKCLQEVRTLSYVLHPPLLDEVGLSSALRWFAKGFSERSGIHVEVDAAEIRSDLLTSVVATTVFRVAQEALSNVHRHSGSKWARIVLCRTVDGVCLDVIDGGLGLTAPLTTDQGVQTVGVGISGMRVRLEQLGGRLTIESNASGTRVSATVPLVESREPFAAASAS
jgi:PAS domain S-box-containing protein